MLQTALALDTLLISLCIVATGDPCSAYAFYYVWLLPTVTLLATGTLLRLVTDRLRRSEARLRHAAGHDALTGLANRGLFAARLEAALSERDGDLRAVAFIDLDHFKPVNDGLGHPVGDALLVAVAERLRA